jgi:hypothetical protein
VTDAHEILVRRAAVLGDSTYLSISLDGAPWKWVTGDEARRLGLDVGAVMEALAGPRGPVTGWVDAPGERG